MFTNTNDLHEKWLFSTLIMISLLYSIRYENCRSLTKFAFERTLFRCQNVHSAKNVIIELQGKVLVPLLFRMCAMLFYYWLLFLFLFLYKNKCNECTQYKPQQNIKWNQTPIWYMLDFYARHSQSFCVNPFISYSFKKNHLG